MRKKGLGNKLGEHKTNLHNVNPLAAWEASRTFCRNSLH